MKKLVILALTLGLSLSTQANLQEHYSALVSYVKSEVEWSYVDDWTGEHELVLLDESSLSFTRLGGEGVTYKVTGTVINFDEDLGKEYGRVSCTISLEQRDGRWSRVMFKSSCECEARFVCGEREGNIW